MPLAFMERCVAGDLVGASAAIGAATPAALPGHLDVFFRVRMAQLQEDRTLQPWLGRAMVLLGPLGPQVIGSVGFHGAPDEDRRVEIGYQVEPEFQRQGYATEAVTGLIAWAHLDHAIDRFRASVSPDNATSQRLLD